MTEITPEEAKKERQTNVVFKEAIAKKQEKQFEREQEIRKAFVEGEQQRQREEQQEMEEKDRETKKRLASLEQGQIKKTTPPLEERPSSYPTSETNPIYPRTPFKKVPEEERTEVSKRLRAIEQGKPITPPPDKTEIQPVIHEGQRGPLRTYMQGVREAGLRQSTGRK
jgi:hypothetical protein